MNKIFIICIIGAAFVVAQQQAEEHHGGHHGNHNFTIPGVSEASLAKLKEAMQANTDKTPESRKTIFQNWVNGLTGDEKTNAEKFETEREAKMKEWQEKKNQQ